MTMQMDDDFLTGTESQLRISIARLFNPPKNRILTDEQWWKKAFEIDNQIVTAIHEGRLPKHLMISRFVRSHRNFFLKGLISKADFVRQFQAVSDYLQDQENQSDDARMRSYRDIIEGMK